MAEILFTASQLTHPAPVRIKRGRGGSYVRKLNDHGGSCDLVTMVTDNRNIKVEFERQ